MSFRRLLCQPFGFPRNDRVVSFRLSLLSLRGVMSEALSLSKGEVELRRSNLCEDLSIC
jgi:hypothetical protein